MDKKQSLTWEGARSAISDLAVTGSYDGDAGTGGVSAAAPIGHTVRTADRISAEAIDGAGRRPRKLSADVAALSGGKSDG